MLYHHYLAIVILVSMYIYIYNKENCPRKFGNTNYYVYDDDCVSQTKIFALMQLLLSCFCLPWNNENLPNLIYLFRLAQLGVRRQKISQNEIFFRLYYYQSSSYCSILILVHILNCNRNGTSDYFCCYCCFPIFH